MREWWLIVRCILIGHKWYYTGRDDDWLNGGHYFYECELCGKTKITTPYQGGT